MITVLFHLLLSNVSLSKPSKPLSHNAFSLSLGAISKKKTKTLKFIYVNKLIDI